MGLRKHQKFALNWLQSLIVILIVLGVFFRFYHLDQKVYWYDETMTSMRISGHTQTEVVQQVYNQRAIAVKDLLQRYQYPNRENNLTDTLNALAGSPEHSPLYYLLARFWLQTFGNSVATIRLLSAVISLLALPCTYWLCLELFGLPLVSWIAVALIAISPFHVLYAQEAREYSLWTVSILLSSVAILRAIRLRTFFSWGIYTVSVALGLYTHPFSIFVFIGHSIYVLVTEGCRWSKQLSAYLLASLGGLILFIPWLLLIMANSAKFLENTAFVNADRAGFLPLFWGLNLSRIFFDVNQGTSPFSPLHYLSGLLAGYALYYLYRHAPLKAWLFIICLIGVMGMALIVPDLLLGGHRSSITRYATPCYLGIQIAVAYLLAANVATPLRMKVQQRWRSVIFILACCGVISCVVSAQLPVWWHKSYAKSRYNPSVAHTINQSDRPLVISDQIPGIVLSLSHLLNPEVHLQLLVEPNRLRIPDNFPHVFLYKPSQQLQQQLEQQQIQLEDIYQSWLWQVKQ